MHHGEHGQRVDGEAGDCQHPEGAQQHHRYRDGGDQRCPDILQKEEHDHKDQQYCLEQGLDHLFDGDLDKGGRVIGINDLHAGRKVSGQFRHLCPDPLAVSSALAPAAMPDGHAANRLPVIKDWIS